MIRNREAADVSRGITDAIINKPVLAVIPTYNEAANIRPVVEQLFSLNISPHIMVIDDNSPDGTADILAALQEKYPSRLFVMRRDRKLGLGSAYKQGFDFALKGGYEIIIQIDADLSHSPSCLVSMCVLLDSCDLVIGSRYVRGGGLTNWSGSRIFLSRFANIFCQLLLGVPVKDMTSGFKCMKRSVLENIQYDTIISKGYAFQVELVYRAYRAGFSIQEYPITFRGRVHEKSKMSFAIVIEAFLRILALSCRRIPGYICAPMGAAHPHRRRR